MSATNIPSECKIANIALNDVMILPYDANPGRIEFSERATGKSCHGRWGAYGTSGEYSEAPLSTRGASRMREIRTYGSMRGARGNSRPYRNPYWPRSATRSGKISRSTLDSPRHDGQLWGPFIRICRRPHTFLTSTLSECSHLGHVKVPRSNPGLPGSMCARYICLVHFGHRGRSYIVGFVDVYPNCNICTSS